MPSSVLALASLEVPVKSFKKTPTRIGDDTRAFDGSFRSTVRTTKHTWEITTGQLYDADAATLRTALLPGAAISATGSIMGGTVSVYAIEVDESPGGTSPFTTVFTFRLEEA